MNTKEKENLRIKLVDAMTQGTFKFNAIRLSSLEDVLKVVEEFISVILKDKIEGFETDDNQFIDPSCQRIYYYPDYATDRIPSSTYLNFNNTTREWEKGPFIRKSPIFLKRSAVDAHIKRIHEDREKNSLDVNKK